MSAMVLTLIPPSSPLDEAARHYKHLLDKGFKRSYSLKVVGDKYMLSKHNRIILYRCIHSTTHVLDVMRRTLYNVAVEDVLCIDFYNVLITIFNIVNRTPLYLGNDKFLRDMSGVHGRIRHESKFTTAFRTLTDHLMHFKARKTIYLESQVSKSGEFASLIRQYLQNNSDVYLHKNVDTVLSRCKGIVATSDSVIHMKAERIIDIPRLIAESTDLMVTAIDFSYF